MKVEIVDVGERVSTAHQINLLNLDVNGLTEFFKSIGEKPYRAQQVIKWIHKRGMKDFTLMTDLSKKLREQLSELCVINAPEIVKEQCSSDGTRKWLMRVDTQNLIETVFIPEEDRGTLCISSQVGCALNCSFCSTATQGFNRNLTVSEIIGQVWNAANRLREIKAEKEKLEHKAFVDEKTEQLEHSDSKKLMKTEDGEIYFGGYEITNVVLMGMGEPLLNFEAVKTAMSIMREDNAYMLPRRRVTLSTSGLVPMITRLEEECDVALAVSLHAPNDELRNTLVPINKKYPIKQLMEACRHYAGDDRRRKITMEYVMLKDVNDKPEHAKQLVNILQNVPCKVNLIPFNPFKGAQYERSTAETILNFRGILIRSGLIATVRKTRGDDIDAACGQLVGKILDRTSRQAKFQATLEGKVKSGCSSNV